MSSHPFPYSLFPLGDSALTISCGSGMDAAASERVRQLFALLQQLALPFVTGLVPAYNSLAVHYDLLYLFRKGERGKPAYDQVAEMMQRLFLLPRVDREDESRLVQVPVCYEGPFAPDLPEVARLKGCSTADVIRRHTEGTFRVYFIGFLPGFAYMGEVGEDLAVPRKSTPGTRVEAGSVGLAGRQTGIYPVPSPGGWQIIGRTPLLLFDPGRKEPVFFHPGDRVQFYSITKHEFDRFESGIAGHHPG